MSPNGTARYRLQAAGSCPDLVLSAVAAATELGFQFCVHPATGRLLQLLAAGVPAGGVIGETGTGTGAGLAWMATGAGPDVSLVSVEQDGSRAAAARRVFSGRPNVTVLHGDAGAVFERGPFDLLVHDGGWGSAKMGGPPVEPATVLRDGAIMTVDDYTPMDRWPPTYQDRPDEGRIHWLQHPDLLATEIRLAPDLAVIVARYTPGRHAPGRSAR